MKKSTFVSVLCVLLVTNTFVAAESRDIEGLIGKCVQVDRNACEKLDEAVGKLTDQNLLSKIALECGESWNSDVGLTAVGKLTDQASIEKIAVESKDNSIRRAAVEKLTDQGLLAKIAIESDFMYADVGRTAVWKLTDQWMLARIAIDGRDAQVRGEAAKKLTDQALLAKIAVESNDETARGTAIEKLTDQSLLTKIADQEKSRDIRAKAIAAMDESNPALKRSAGDLNALTADAVESTARIKLAIHESHITNRFPKLLFRVKFGPYEQRYFSVNGSGIERTMSGEVVSFTLSQATVTLFSPPLANKQWGTHFPAEAKELTFLAAQVHGEDLLAELLHNAEFTQDDLTELSLSDIPELRQAAVKNLTDQEVLAKVAIEDKIRDVRLAAVVNLTDQKSLAKVAIEAGDSDIRQSASGKVTDQALRAKIALNDKARATSELRHWLKWLVLVVSLILLVSLTKSLLKKMK